MNQSRHTFIESLGVYLPPKSVATSEVLAACKNPIPFPLERITGIKSRRLAGEEEFSIDLSRKAIVDCMEKSRHGVADVDLLICCNISRYDGPGCLSFEPSTSARLRAELGLSKALVFDLTNACAGMFTGIYLADAFIRTGAVRRALVVSGEYITHLTRTAQREIENFMDSRMACLTLGDAAAAVLLEEAPEEGIGFQEIDLRTFGRYSPYCVAEHAQTGGMIMYTDSVHLTDVAMKAGADHSLGTLQEAGWPPDSFQHLIMHQTSRTTLNSARREINLLLEQKVFDDHNTINNLEERGNTASTSHFIALADQIRGERIQSGDRLVFSVSASGLTVGTALYVLDDLPDRMREVPPTTPDGREEPGGQQPVPALPPIRVESVWKVKEGEDQDTMVMLKEAALTCLQRSAYTAGDIDLLIYTGVYRTKYVLEPAYAALLAGELDMNASTSGSDGGKTLAFDIFNGAVGFLNACQVARQLIGLGKVRTAMIVAAEAENNAEFFPDQLLGVRQTASALILDAESGSGAGFSLFHFQYDGPAMDDAYWVYSQIEEKKARMVIQKEPELETRYIENILLAVRDILKEAGLEPGDIDWVLPPQISSGFIDRLGRALKIPVEKFVDATGGGADLFSSSLPFAMAHIRENDLVRPGDTGLVITAGSGLQVGCGIYRF